MHDLFALNVILITGTFPFVFAKGFDTQQRWNCGSLALKNHKNFLSFAYIHMFICKQQMNYMV